MQAAEARTYIPEPKRQRRKWTGKADERAAVYANRRRVQGRYGKALLKKRGELIERSFAHCYETGAMRRVYLRGRENVWKRQLIHVGAFNLSLILRQILGAGTPRELRNRLSRLLFVSLWLRNACRIDFAHSIADLETSLRRKPAVQGSLVRFCRHGISTGCTSGS
jgi:transposase